MAGPFILHAFGRPKPLSRGAELREALIASGFLTACLLLSACATPYKPYHHHYGYSEVHLSNDVYEVSFLGNGNTSYQRALDFAMLRASEIALSHHAKSFTLLDLDNLSSARPYTTPARFYWSASPYLGPGGQAILPAASLLYGPDWSFLVFESAQTRIYYRPGVRLKVKLLPDPPGSYYPYDPVKESARIRRQYRIK